MTEPLHEPETTLGLPSDERNLALFGHLGTLAGYSVGFGHILVPLIIWVLKKDESEFVRVNAVESLNFQIIPWKVLSWSLSPPHPRSSYR